MIKIKKGSTTLTVSKGAYEDIFRQQGFIPVDEIKAPEDTPVVSEEPIVPAQEEDADQKAEPPEETGKQEEDADQNQKDEDADDDLTEKPLSEMTLQELKAYAALKGVNIGALTKKDEIKEAIKAQGGV